MPVIITANNNDAVHPFLQNLSTYEAIRAERALRQDIRPLEIAIVNLMADKRATEEQLAEWLGRTPLQVKLTFAATDGYIDSIRSGREPSLTPSQHILDFYKPFREIQDRPFDGLLVTGVNALQERVEQEDIWPHVQRILDWSASHVFSSAFLCWGAKAALKHFHNIDSIKGQQKIFGLFPHRLHSDSTGLLTGFPDEFPIPVSRWKTPREDQIRQNPQLEIVAECPEVGSNILVESKHNTDGQIYPRRVYILSHPEYATDELQKEYRRDSAHNPDYPLPKHYFPHNDPAHALTNSWRHTGHVYTNWVQSVYEATPFDLQNLLAS